jgi:hypothetical protein
LDFVSNSDDLNESAGPQWVNTRQAAGMLGCSESQVCTLGRAGVLSHNGAAKNRKFLVESINAYLRLFRSPLTAPAAVADPAGPADDPTAATEQPELPVVHDDPLTAAGMRCTHGMPPGEGDPPRRMVLICPEGEVAGFGVRFADGSTAIRRTDPYNGWQLIDTEAEAEAMFGDRDGTWRLTFTDHHGHGGLR